MGEVISITSRSSVVVTRPMRERLPSDIKLSIDNWRLGGCVHAIPADYLEWHYHLAAEELDRIAEKYRLEILNDPRLFDPDFCRAFIVTVLTGRQHHLELEWDDTRQAFMKRVPQFAGYTLEPLRESDLA